MYLVRLPEDHPVHWLFLNADPRLEGCSFLAEAPVNYSDEAYLVALDPQGAGLTRTVLGRSSSQPHSYKRFIRNGARIEPDYERLEGTAIALPSWSMYARALRLQADDAREFVQSQQRYGNTFVGEHRKEIG